MIEQNRKKFEICNIPLWWSKGYTGKGIKIANMERANPNLYFFDGKVKDPFRIGKNDYTNKHGNKTADVLHQVAPDADIYILSDNGRYTNDKASGDFIETSLPYIQRKGIHLVNASLKGQNSKELNKKILETQELGTVFITSAGNEGENGLTSYAKSNIWISVAALGYKDKSGNIYLKKYSSRGKELDISCFSGLYIHDARKGYENRVFRVEGTSFSSPMLCGMLALVQQYFLEKVGRTLYQDEILQFIQDHVVDLGEEGHDELYGHGLFVLPDPDTIDPYKYLLREVKNVDKQGFIHSILEGAKDGYRQYRILPSLTIAQAILESSWGTHHIENNIFGMKATSNWTGKTAVRKTKEYINGEWVTVEAAFRAYDSFNDSVRDHNKLLGELDRYKKVRQATDYRTACLEVWKAGYATDPNYPYKLIDIIETYNLDVYDREVIEEMQEHWAEKHWKSLNEKGIIVHEKRFDDNITRGEMMALVDRLTDWIRENKEV